MNNLAEWLLAVFERSGTHVAMGGDLYRTFIKAGLPEPVLQFEAPMGGSETWAGYPYIANSSFGSWKSLELRRLRRLTSTRWPCGCAKKSGPRIIRSSRPHTSPPGRHL